MTTRLAQTIPALQQLDVSTQHTAATTATLAQPTAATTPLDVLTSK